MRRWRTLLAGVALAAVGFVAAQAGALGFLKIDLGHLTQGADDKPAAVQVSNSVHRSYSTASAGREQGTFINPARASTSAAAAELGAASDDAQATGETTVDAVDLFELPSVATSIGQTAANDPLTFGNRFRGLVDGAGAGAGSQRPSYGGSQGRRGQTALADCCADSAAQSESSRLTQPVLADALSGPAPESATWTMMILGLGLAGGLLRGQRRRLAA
jgi:hypothetical protein